MSLRPDMIVEALRALNRPANAPQIHEEICRLFPGEALGATPVASIRARLQEACPQSGQFQHRRSLFRRVSPVEAREGMWGLLEQANIPIEDNILNDLKDVSNDQTANETERRTLAQARIGQGRFRRDLCVVWDSACAVTGVTVPELLRASHIKPWRESSNFERLDENNGLLLIASLDAAFDKNLISFEDDGYVVFSQYLGENPCSILGLSRDSRIVKKFNQHQLNYLRYNRQRLR